MSPALGMMIGELEREISLCMILLNIRKIRLRRLGSIFWAATGVGVAVTSTARRVAKNKEKKISVCILNKRRLKIEGNKKGGCQNG